MLDIVVGIIASMIREQAAALGDISYGIAGLSALFVAAVFRFCIRTAKENRVVDWRFATLGLWKQPYEREGEPMLSIFEISYERKKREFAIVGHTLLLDQSLFSDWRSVSVEFPEQDVVWYMYKARIHRDQPKDVFGISRLVFLERLGTYGRFIEMKGTYSDVSSGGREIPFTATRASRKEIQEIRKHPLDERMLLDSSPKGKLDREEVKAAGPQG